MIIGVPKEIKTREYRVGLVPGGAAALVQRGHTVLVEKGAGIGACKPCGPRGRTHEATRSVPLCGLGRCECACLLL